MGKNKHYNTVYSIKSAILKVTKTPDISRIFPEAPV